MDAFAVEYIAVHDRPPIGVPNGKGCACWAAIARQIALGLFPLRLQPGSTRLDQISLRSFAIFLNGSLSVFALRRTAKVVRFRALAIVSTLFALRTSARSSLSCSGVQGARGVPVISASPSASIWPPQSSTGQRGCGPLPCCASSALPSLRHLFLTALAFGGVCLPQTSKECFRPGSFLRPHRKRGPFIWEPGPAVHGLTIHSGERGKAFVS